MPNNKTIRIAIAGVGNCASALLQGLAIYGKSQSEKPPGLAHESIGGYTCADIDIVVAFDIDKRKVGRSLKNAHQALPNCMAPICDIKIPGANIIVQMGPVLDGYPEHMDSYPDDHSFIVAKTPPVDLVDSLTKSKADVLVCYMPVGADNATKAYAQACLDAGVAMINCAPCFIASNHIWAKKFKKANLPIIGDDIKSQIGATIVHRTMTKLFQDRGVKLTRTYQLNTGGNTDFLNMLARERLTSKKISKTQSVQSQLDVPLCSDNIHIGPSDYVPWQKDNKIAFIRMEGEGFGGQKMELEMRLSVQDSPNSAGIVVDAIRCAWLAKKYHLTGPIEEVCAYYMKSPPVQFSDDQAKMKVEEFISQKE